MRDMSILFLHLIVTIVKLAGPGGARSIVAEFVLIKQQLLVVNRSRKRCPNLRESDRIVVGLGSPVPSSICQRAVQTALDFRQFAGVDFEIRHDSAAFARKAIASIRRDGTAFVRSGRDRYRHVESPA
jgi:hypothetical protein